VIEQVKTVHTLVINIILLTSQDKEGGGRMEGKNGTSVKSHVILNTLGSKILVKL
jgi:hypothetical protein